ncbi:MAG TPA: hypothetical protein VM243_11610 [Phycisphaerae bacterium]|nr:hypothetical protein [Phycisphaerae bacterium]
MKRSCLWTMAALLLAVGVIAWSMGLLDEGPNLVRPASAAIIVPQSVTIGGGGPGPVPTPIPLDADPVQITTTVGPACDVSGLQFTLEVCNMTDGPLDEIVVTDTLPIGLNYLDGSLVAVDANGDAFPVALCAPPMGPMIEICFLEPLPAGECVTITIVATFEDALCNHVVVTAGGPGTQADEGCSPGFWKNHFSEWEVTGYQPADDFDATFTVDAFDPDLTLEQAINQGGGGVKALGRHAVAALLNAAHPDIDFGLTVAEVISLVQGALGPGGDIEGVKDQLDALNGGSCLLGESEDGTGGEVLGSDTDCADELLGGFVDCVCSTSGPGGEPCDVAAFCDLSAAQACDPYAIENCIAEWITCAEEGMLTFYDDRCFECCPGDPTCQCIIPE